MVEELGFLMVSWFFISLFYSPFEEGWQSSWYSNDFHIKKDSYDHLTFQTATVSSNPFDGLTASPVAGGAVAGHDAFGEGQHSKAPKSDLPEASQKAAVVDVEEKVPEAEATPEKAEGGEGDGVFAVPAAAEATPEGREEVKEEKKVRVVFFLFWFRFKTCNSPQLFLVVLGGGSTQKCGGKNWTGKE